MVGGLTTPEQYIPGRYSYMAPIPLTYQPSLRECRVIAMQWHIQNYLGIEKTPKELVSSLIFMPDFCNVPRASIGDYDGYVRYDEERLVFLENKMVKYSKDKYTLEFFNKEWKRKNDLLKKALQT